MTINTFELSTKYDPKLTESKWQKAWETHQVFKAEATKKKKFFAWSSLLLTLQAAFTWAML